MRYNIKFQGGKLDGAYAEVEMPQFKVGMVIPIGSDYYKALDGPAAHVFEHEGPHPNLMAVLQFVSSGENN